MLYPAAMPRARSIRLPVFVQHDDDLLATGWVTDVHTGPWFPHGTTFTQVHTFPGTTTELTNDYTIVTTAQPRRAPLNHAIQSCMHIAFRGNVLVLRHGQRHPLMATNVHYAERGLIQQVVQQ